MSDEKHDIDLRQKEIMQQFKEVTMQIWKEFVAKYSEPIKVKFKKLSPDAKEPVRATDGAAGWDLTVCTRAVRNYYVHYKTGIAVEIPSGYFGLIVPRSSCYKLLHWLTNGAGIIDSDYRGEICFNYYRGKEEGKQQNFMYKPGERCGQLLILPCPAVEFVKAEELSETIRGTGGFGSTGK